MADIFDPTDGGGAGAIAPLGLGLEFPTWPDAMEVLAAYNKVLADCAARYDFVHLVSIREPFLGHGVQCRQSWRANYRSEDPHFWYLNILEDPNDRGYDALRRLFLLEMLSVIGR